MKGIRLGLCLATLIGITGEARALSVSITTSVQTHTFTDDDVDGDVEIDTVLDGELDVLTVVKEQHDAFRTRVTFSPPLPFLESRFANVSASPHTYIITATSTPPGPISAPLGFDLFYNGSVDDPVDMSVDVPSHFVTGYMNNGVVYMGGVLGPPINSTSTFNVEFHGTVPSTSADDVLLGWTIQLGANDEISLPTDDDFEGESIQRNVFNPTQKCIDKMNNAARQVANTSQKDDQKCLKTTGTDVTVCVDNPAEEKTEKKEAKLVEGFASYCDPLPTFGVEGDGCCDGGTGDGSVCADSSTCGGGTCLAGECIAAAADLGTNDLIHDLFGASIVVSADKDTYKCQQAVWKSVGQLYVERWKQFRGCKRDNFASIVDDASLVNVCLDPQPDLSSKIDKRRVKVIDTVQKKCLDQGLSGLSAVFPGACSSELDANVGACATHRAACRFCRAANGADAIDPAVDCDTFDDGMANASCAP